MEEESGCEESVDGISGGVRSNFEYQSAKSGQRCFFKRIKICLEKQISFDIIKCFSCDRMCWLASARLSFATRTGWRQGRPRQTKVFVFLNKCVMYGCKSTFPFYENKATSCQMIAHIVYLWPGQWTDPPTGAPGAGSTVQLSFLVNCLIALYLVVLKLWAIICATYKGNIYHLIYLEVSCFLEQGSQELFPRFNFYLPFSSCL